MTPVDLVRVTAAREHLGGVLADRLEHREARFLALLVEADEALVHELAQPVDDLAADLAGRAADGLGHVQLEPAAEHRQPIEQVARAVVEQVVAPGDRAAERLLSLRQVPRPARQRGEVVVEARVDLVRRQQLDPGRRELDRQRHPVEARGDPGDRRRVRVRDREPRLDRGRPRDEQAHRLELVERVEVEFAQLAREVQPIDLGQAASCRAGPAGPGPGTPARPRRGGRSAWSPGT